MADNTTPTGASIDEKALQPDDGTTVPRIKMAEVGFSALKSRSGKMYEEANRAFTYPNMLKVVDEMKLSPPVAIGLQAINTLMNRSEVYVQPVQSETPTDRARREYLESVLHDMDESWQTTMQHISTFKEYGHSLSEIVYRRRLYVNGSKYNDGKIGLAGLKNRPQNSVAKWNWSLDGRQLVSVSQTIAALENSSRFSNLTDANGFIVIPREKLLLFRADPTSDNPEGNSILKSAYLAYKQLSLLSDHLMTSVAKDVAGVPFAQIPAQYMSPDASDSEKAVFTAIQGIVKNLSSGIETAVVFPKLVDPDTKSDMFSLSLLEPKTGKAFDIPAIISMLQANILSVLSADSITMGSNQSGSLSLADGDTNLLALAVSYRLGEIANTLNQELVPALWKANAWSTENLPLIKFKDVSSVSIEEFTKGVQRLASTSMLEVSRPILNKIYEVMGFEQRPDEEPVDRESLSAVLTGQVSGASEGMGVGTSGDGTAKNGTAGTVDRSTNNADNSA